MIDRPFKSGYIFLNDTTRMLTFKLIFARENSNNKAECNEMFDLFVVGTKIEISRTISDWNVPLCIFHKYTSQLPSLVFKQRCVPFSLMIINYEVREVKFHQIFSSFQQQNIMYYWRHLLFFTRDPPLSILKTFKSIQDLISLMDIQIKVCKWFPFYPNENREVLVQPLAKFFTYLSKTVANLT